MITKKLLPVGSIVLLKDSTKKLVVVGVLQAKPGSLERVYDYCGCLYPEGYLEAEKFFLFDEEQIEEICFMGFSNEEQEEFERRVREVIKKLVNDKADRRT